jgi:hypothetical protein
MPAITTDGAGARRARRLAWFVAIYIAGVAVVTGVALLIRLEIRPG